MAIMNREALPQPMPLLLDRLMEIEDLSAFALGGGTSLALRYGHRRSVDIDLFTNNPFISRTPGSLCVSLEGVKVDLLHHAYPVLKPIEAYQGIRCLSIQDMAAMKINAITNRGSKKDFTDILLLHHQGIDISSALDLFCEKYGEEARFLAIRSLLYIDDAQDEPDPFFLNGWTWPSVRDEITILAKNLTQSSPLPSS